MPKPLRETTRITAEAASQARKSGQMLVQFISPGWGSSGYYSPAVIEQAAADVVIPAGTHMYADHATEAELRERPVRSVKDLMAVTTEDARLSEDGALVGNVQVVPAWRDLVETVKDSIGVSIWGSASDIVAGEAEGRQGGIIESLVAPVTSVDFVTRPGRGGKVLSVLESARATRRAVDRGVAEATADERREQLSDVVRTAYGAQDRWLWVRDFDEATVWFEISAEDEPSRTWQQTYDIADDDLSVSLTGERIEVRTVTKYVPATRPDNGTTPSSTPSTESEEDTMPEIKIDEAEHTRLVTEAGRVATLEAERDQARADLAARDRRERAIALVGERAAEAKVTFTSLEQRGLLADLPVKEDALDEVAFTATVDEAAKSKATDPVAGGTGVSGFGAYVGQPGTAPAAEAATPTPTRSPWGRPLSEQKGA